jgi:hypothetical protein
MGHGESKQIITEEEVCLLASVALTLCGCESSGAGYLGENEQRRWQCAGSHLAWPERRELRQLYRPIFGRARLERDEPTINCAGFCHKRISGGGARAAYALARSIFSLSNIF